MNFLNRILGDLPAKLRAPLHQISGLTRSRNQKAVLVGGVVRDVLLDRSVFDADVMIEPPVKPLIDQMIKENPHIKVISHERFLTFTLVFDVETKLDIVTAREEVYNAPAQLPQVKPATIERDLKRRDFTINAMACWLNGSGEGGIVDPFHGREDLEHKIIRVIHDKSFLDDPTRIYRAARFASRFGFHLEQATKKALEDTLQKRLPELLSPVRRRHEFELILKEENPSQSLSLIKRWGAMAFLHPEWKSVPSSYFSLLDRKPEPVGAPSLVTWRLGIWFKPWGKTKASQVMTDLAFEKDVKRDVLLLL